MVNEAKSLGIRDFDAQNAEDFIEHLEYSLCFDTVTTQMYEYDIKITREFYKLIEELAISMNLPSNNYLFMKELILDKE